jgi:hypothetical protein
MWTFRGQGGKGRVIYFLRNIEYIFILIYIATKVIYMNFNRIFLNIISKIINTIIKSNVLKKKRIEDKLALTINVVQP